MPKGDNLRGAAWLIADMALNIWALSIVKALGLGYPAAQIVFLRAATGLVILAPWILAERRRFRETDRWRLHLIRVGLSVITLTASFFAIARLPLALFSAIGFTRPLVLMLMAALLLGERISKGRWAAAACGLLGVIIATAPGSVAWSPGLPAMALVVFTGTGAIIATRALKGTPAIVMMTFYTGGLALVTGPVALAAWESIVPEHRLPLLAIGVFAQAAQYCFLRAHWLGEASVLGPMGYLSLIFSTAVGFFVFAEIPSLGMALGAAIILLSTAALARL